MSRDITLRVLQAVREAMSALRRRAGSVMSPTTEHRTLGGHRGQPGVGLKRPSAPTKRACFEGLNTPQDTKGDRGTLLSISYIFPLLLE